jgi:hypothetical protein
VIPVVWGRQGTRGHRVSPALTAPQGRKELPALVENKAPPAVMVLTAPQVNREPLDQLDRRVLLDQTEPLERMAMTARLARPDHKVSQAPTEPQARSDQPDRKVLRVRMEQLARTVQPALLVLPEPMVMTVLQAPTAQPVSLALPDQTERLVQREPMARQALLAQPVRRVPLARMVDPELKAWLVRRDQQAQPVTPGHRESKGLQETPDQLVRLATLVRRVLRAKACARHCRIRTQPRVTAR